MARRDTLRNISRLMHLGHVFEREGKLADARRSFTEALGGAERAQQHELVFQASEALAAVEVRAGDLARAREHLHRCLEIRFGLALFVHALINLIGLEREDRQYARAFVLGAVAYNLLVELGSSWESHTRSTSDTLDVARSTLGPDWLARVEQEAREQYPALRERLADQVATPDDFRVPMARWLLDRSRELGMGRRVDDADSLALDLWSVGTAEPAHPVVLRMVSRGLRNALVTQGRYGTLSAAEVHFSRLKELAQRYPADREIQSHYAPSVFSLLTYQLRSGPVADPAFPIAELTSLVERFPDDPQFRQILGEVEKALSAPHLRPSSAGAVDLVRQILDGSPSLLNALLSAATPDVLQTIDALAASETDPDRRRRVDALRNLVALKLDAGGADEAARAQHPPARQAASTDSTPAAPAQTADPAAVLQLIGTFINAREASAREHFLARHPELLTPDTDALLGRVIEFAAQRQPELVQRLERGRTLLRNVRDGKHDGTEHGSDADAAPSRASEPEVPLAFAAERQEVMALVGSLPTSATAREHCIVSIERLLRDVGPRHPAFRAEMLNILGIAHRYSQSAAHLRRAISCYEDALGLVAIDSSPSLYAATCTNLGNAYADLQEGDRQANLRRAIECYQQALRINTRTAAPFEHARDTYNMGTAYAELADPADAELAKRCFMDALQVFTREAAPVPYAQVQNSLGAVHLRQAAAGNAADARAAVSCFENALPHLGAAAAPREYAAVQANLGRAYNVLAERGDVPPDRAVACFQEALRVYAPETTPVEYARTLLALASAHTHWKGEDRAAHLREAIRCYEGALAAVTPDTSSDDYVSAQLGLAASLMAEHSADPGRTDALQRALDSYEEALRHLAPGADVRKRIIALEGLAHGSALMAALQDRVPHLQRAVECRHELRQLRSPEIDRDAFASDLNTLGALHMELAAIEGDPAPRREQAIACFEEGLRHVGPEQHTEVYARLLTNLALATQGDRGLELLQSALAYRPLTRDPTGYSLIMHNLGSRYAACPSGDRAADLARAIECYREALRVRTFESTPRDYAMSMLGLGGAYVELPVGDRDTNLELAIECCGEALRYFSADRDPYEYAQAETNLANARLQLPANQLANLQQAAAGYERALSSLSPEAAPLIYARIRMNHTNVLARLVEHGAGSAERRHVIEGYEDALKWIRAEARPLEYAQLQINLGNAYRMTPGGDSSPDLERAITCYQLAIEASPLETEPRLRRVAAVSLGRRYFGENRWDEAHAAFALAVAASDAIDHASAAESSRLAELADAPDLYAEDGYCLAKLARAGEAVERLEEGRARLLAEALDRDRADLERLAEDERRAFTEVASRIRRLETAARAAGRADEAARTFSEVSRELRSARRELETLIGRIRVTRPGFMARTFGLDAILSAVRPACPTTYLVTTSQGSVALILPPGHDAPDVVWLETFTAVDLERLLFWKSQYHHDGEVVGGLLGGQVSGNTDSLREELDLALPTLRDRLMDPLAAYLKQRGFERATLIPYGLLSLVPLHACGEGITWTYVASSRLLQFAIDSAEQRSRRPPALLGVGDPVPTHQPLAFARAEVEDIAERFPPDARCLLLDLDATLADVRRALPGPSHVHIACHGTFGEDDPLDSALHLAADDRVTLRDLMEGGLDVSTVRLVVLSACQTAIIDFTRAPNEAIGFPAGLLQAGVPGVVSSLWRVDDLSTAILMGRFYEEMLARGRDGALALRAAQEWLRAATAGELGLADRYHRRFEASEQRDTRAFHAMQHFRANPEARPFAHPYYWAGFTFTGV